MHHIFNVLQEMQNMEAYLEAEYGRDSDGELNVKQDILYKDVTCLGMT